jgi:hypothetical protein
MSETLGEAFPREQARLRTLLGYGQEMGAAAAVYCAVVEDVLRRADRAASEGDTGAMLRIFKEMQEIKG